MLPTTLTVRVADKRRETADVVSLCLELPDGELLPSFEAGAHIDVHVAPHLVRQYSLYNAPGERHRYRIAVLRETSSRGGSLGLHEHVQRGDLIEIGVPRNHFVLHADTQPGVLLAGGIGITPLLAMAESLSARNAPFALHYCVRSRDRAALVDHIEQSVYADALQLHCDDGPPAQRLDLDETFARDDGRTHYYVCGPGGYIDAVLAAARRAGCPDARLHSERFAAPAAEDAVGAAFEVRLASSGLTVSVPAGVSVVDALGNHGIDIATSCGQGACGCCLTKILSGIPDHRDAVLTDAQRAANDRFLPCVSRARSRTLVLDL